MECYILNNTTQYLQIFVFVMSENRKNMTKESFILFNKLYSNDTFFSNKAM